MPLILSGNVTSATAGAYDVANSCRFNDNDSAYVHKTCGSAFDTDKFTISLWCKRGTLGIETRLISCDNDDGSDDDYLKFQATDQLEFTMYDGGYTGTLKTNALFRDISAWYHIVAVWDSGNATAGNRMRLYVNGTEVTSFATDTNPDEDANATFGNTSHPIEIGRRGTNGTQYWDGYLAEVAVCDGQAYAASDFGEFDEDSPTIWKPKNVSGLTFGTSGFYLDFEASGNLGNDANGGTDFTEVNIAAADQATDTPTNSFATMNNLIPGVSNITYSEGNLLITQTTAAWVKTNSTFGMSAGKWYWEAKCVGDNSGVGSWLVVGADNTDTATTASGMTTTSVGWKKNGNIGVATSLQTDIATYAEGDILSVALDMDNDAIYFRKNGAAWENSGDPTSGSDKTGAYSLPVANSTYFATISPYDTSIAGMNFGGCPAFAISSGNADADGYGNFEYAPPSGYYSLCTKNLGAYGG